MKRFATGQGQSVMIKTFLEIFDQFGGILDKAAVEIPGLRVMAALAMMRAALRKDGVSESRTVNY